MEREYRPNPYARRQNGYGQRIFNAPARPGGVPQQDGAPTRQGGAPARQGGVPQQDSALAARRSHEIDYRIYGDDMQFVEVELDRGETVIAEAGAMMYMEDGIEFEAKMGDGTEPKGQKFFGKLVSGAKRVMSGESLFITHFTHVGQKPKSRVSFAASYPGKIIPFDLAALGGKILAQKDSFLCGAAGTQLSVAFNRKLGVGLFGGEGFILQSITGDGIVFIHAGGTVVERYLESETLRVDTGCVVAFQPQISYDIAAAGNLKSMIVGGEGIFLTTLSGTGRVWLQSLPFNRLADRVIANIQPGGSQGEGSVIGGISTIFER